MFIVTHCQGCAGAGELDDEDEEEDHHVEEEHNLVVFHGSYQANNSDEKKKDSAGCYATYNRKTRDDTPRILCFTWKEKI